MKRQPVNGLTPLMLTSPCEASGCREASPRQSMVPPPGRRALIAYVPSRSGIVDRSWISRLSGARAVLAGVGMARSLKLIAPPLSTIRCSSTRGSFASGFASDFGRSCSRASRLKRPPGATSARRSRPSSSMSEKVQARRNRLESWKSTCRRLNAAIGAPPVSVSAKSLSSTDISSGLTCTSPTLILRCIVSATLCVRMRLTSGGPARKPSAT